MFKLRICFRGSCDLYLGDFRSKWMNFASLLLKVNNTIYIDDGMATVFFYNDLSSGKKRLKKSSKIITFFNLISNEKVTVLNVKFNKVEVLADRKSGAIIGMPVADYGMVSEKDYIIYLESVIRHMKNSGVEFITYIAHRNEDFSSVVTRCKNLGVEALRLDVPIEDWLLSAEMPPCKFYSLYSTAIVNFDMMFSGIECYSYKPFLTSFDVKYTEAIDVVYDYIEKNTGIKMIKQISAR